jgi:HK97 family phage portal protein
MKLDFFDALGATDHWRPEPTYRPEPTQVENLTTLIRSGDPQIIAQLGGAPAASGFAVTPETAMRVSAVFAAVQLLGGAIASIPVSIFRDAEEGRQSINPELWWLLNEQPIANWTAASMWEWVMKSICLRGDGFVEIVRKGADVKNLRPHHPDLVDVRRIGDTLIYTVTDETGATRTLHQDDMLHFPGFGFNGTRSMSVIAHAAFQSIGIALATDALSGHFYANGAAPKHVITAPGEMSDGQIDQLRNAYKTKYAGVGNGGLPMVLTEGLALQEMSMTAGDAQLLESRKFQVIDIARAFGVPPHMIGAQETTSSWGTGIEQLSIGFIRWALQPHINRIRQELNRKLFRRASPFVEHKMDALLAGDSKAAGERNRQAIGGSQGPGYMTINEVRKSMNLPPVEGGDVLYRPDKPAAPKPEPKEEDETAGPTDPQ